MRIPAQNIGSKIKIILNLSRKWYPRVVFPIHENFCISIFYAQPSKAWLWRFLNYAQRGSKLHWTFDVLHRLNNVVGKKVASLFPTVSVFSHRQWENQKPPHRWEWEGVEKKSKPKRWLRKIVKRDSFLFFIPISLGINTPKLNQTQPKQNKSIGWFEYHEKKSNTYRY